MGFSTTKFRDVQACIDETLELLKAAGVDITKDVFSSRDPKIQELMPKLVNENVAEGFKKWRLPFFLDRSLAYVTVAEPNAHISEHSHPGSTVRVILSGTVKTSGRELAASDWIYIPNGKEYSLTAGPLGATILGWYPCCC